MCTIYQSAEFMLYVFLLGLVCASQSADFMLYVFCWVWFVQVPWCIIAIAVFVIFSFLLSVGILVKNTFSLTLWKVLQLKTDAE
jgi:hypothetical protein